MAAWLAQLISSRSGFSWLQDVDHPLLAAPRSVALSENVVEQQSMQPATMLPPTVQAEPVAAALLKRSDAPFWRLHFGDDWATFAEQLCEHHCFDVCPVLVIPSLRPGAQAHLEAAIRGMQLRRGWFRATPEQVMALLLQALSVADQLDVPESAPACVMLATAAQPPPSASAGMEPPVYSHSGAGEKPTIDEDEQPASDALMEDLTSESDGSAEKESILQFCEPCASRDAARSCEIRAFLQDKVGKAKAKEMLSKAKITVAQDREGKKNKVLKYGSSLLKLKM